MAPDISPSANLEPFIPVLGPSPMIPLTNDSIPALSGTFHKRSSLSSAKLSILFTAYHIVIWLFAEKKWHVVKKHLIICLSWQSTVL